jgi:hypothetical protein
VVEVATVAEQLGIQAAVSGRAEPLTEGSPEVPAHVLAWIVDPSRSGADGGWIDF